MKFVCVALDQPVRGTQCVFSKLIQAGDINTNLIKACQRGEAERATVLLEYGADVNSQNEVNIHLNTVQPGLSGPLCPRPDRCHTG